MKKIELVPVGFVANSVKEAVDDNWGSVVSRLNIEPKFAKGILHIGQFSHAIVVTFLHRSQFDPARHLLRRPRNLHSMPEVGIFSQRAKDRPNPIGITTVKIEAVGADYVDVRGLDAIDGTPIVDIKPYYLQFDCVPAAKAPPWVDELMKEYF
ncbi:MAG TPA: tRNA (N6-threonylcarbamoyladenosine(37)-N6)-methyltransferase TrmO [Bacteroidota bacterium]|nr:tRNA (N6-threonylcarbamoyladenosine(37)-N6)-methyltransferase TrmO [Bacteroidota bacterium]